MTTTYRLATIDAATGDVIRTDPVNENFTLAIIAADTDSINFAAERLGLPHRYCLVIGAVPARIDLTAVAE